MPDFLRWFHRKPGNSWLTFGGLVATFLLGFFLTFTLPSSVKAASLDAARAEIALVEQNEAAVRQEFFLQERWFSPPYVAQIPGMVQQSEACVKSAKDALHQAESAWSVDRAVLYAKSARASAFEASSTIGQIWDVLNGNSDLLDRSRAVFETVSSEAASLSNLLDGAATRYANEHDRFLLKYTEPMAMSLSTAGNTKASAVQYIAAAHAVLPPPEDKSGIGDPNAALQNLDTAKALVEKVNTLAEQVTAGLDYQREAVDNVDPTIQTADSRITSADRHMSDLATSRGYTKDKALSVADGFFRQAVGFRDQAKSIMASPVTEENGKVDAPAAYEAAKQAIANADQSTAEADYQVVWEDGTRQKLASYASVLISANDTLSQAVRAEQILKNSHAHDVWNDVSMNLDSARSNIQTAENHKNNALSALDISQQRFQDANSEAQRALTALNQVLSLAQAVSDRAGHLEGFRSSWPAAHSNAQSVIAGERSNVESYGSYDSAARNDFNSAVNLLAQAEGEAVAWRYEPAVNNANSAATLASGTGSRSYRAYEDEQDRLRRAEEARKRAAEEAERQRQLQSQNWNNSDSGSSSGGYDFGGSSSGGSDYGGGSYGGDGGDFGGGYSGGDGGDW
jgi:hypothetical protein